MAARLAILAAASLAGCGDGSGTTSTPNPTPTPTPTTTPIALTPQQIYSRPVLTRAYEQGTWTLKGPDGAADRETAASVGAALAGLNPSYVSGVVYIRNGTTITDRMVADYQTIRSAVLARNPNAKFDIEISINPDASKNTPFANADALVAAMTAANARFHPDAWWFDFYSVAQKSDPDWIAAAIKFAHANGQLVGGNVFDKAVPPGSDSVAFVDDVVAGSQYGFDFDRIEVAALKAAAGSTILLGHLQSNPQNGSTTESCTYIQQWTETQRAAYLDYFASQQASKGFTFMYPAFYPICPAAYSFDPLLDPAPGGGTLYTYLQTLVARYNPLK